MVTKVDRDILEEMAKMVGNPRNLDIDMSREATTKLTPYTRDKESKNPDDQFSELFSFRVDPEVMRLVEEIVTLLNPYYRTKSEFGRDAIVKWAKFIKDRMLTGDNPVEPLAIRLDILSRRAWEAEQRRELASTFSRVDRNFSDLLRDHAIEKVAEDAALYVRDINEVNDTYWRDRCIREFVEMPSFRGILSALSNHANYKETPLVRILNDWNNQRYVIPR